MQHILYYRLVEHSQMLEPRQNKIIFTFFSWYIGRLIKGGYQDLHFNKPDFDPDKAILLLANHFSWWDAFILSRINKLYFQKKFHILVTEDNYRKVWFFKYMGAFSIKKSSKDVLLSLQYAGSLLNDPGNLVLIFPQGKLFSNHVSDIVFEKGILAVVNASSKKFQYLFAAAFVDYFENKKPSVTCYLQHWKNEEFVSLQLIKSAYNKHYETSRQKQAKTTV